MRGCVKRARKCRCINRVRISSDPLSAASLSPLGFIKRARKCRFINRVRIYPDPFSAVPLLPVGFFKRARKCRYIGSTFFWPLSGNSVSKSALLRQKLPFVLYPAAACGGATKRRETFHLPFNLVVAPLPEPQTHWKASGRRGPRKLIKTDICAVWKISRLLFAISYTKSQ